MLSPPKLNLRTIYSTHSDIYTNISLSISYRYSHWKSWNPFPSMTDEASHRSLAWRWLEVESQIRSSEREQKLATYGTSTSWARSSTWWKTRTFATCKRKPDDCARKTTISGHRRVAAHPSLSTKHRHLLFVNEYILDFNTTDLFSPCLHRGMLTHCLDMLNVTSQWDNDMVQKADNKDLYIVIVPHAAHTITVFSSMIVRTWQSPVSSPVPEEIWVGGLTWARTNEVIDQAIIYTSG